MNIADIEAAASELATKPYDRASFFLDLATSFGAPDATVARLRRGDTGASDVPGAAIWRPRVHFLHADDVAAGLDRLAASSKTAQHRVRLLVATDGVDLGVEDRERDERHFFPLAELGLRFGVLLPAAGIERYRAVEENPVDVKATGRLAKLYDALVRENPDWGTAVRRHDMNLFMTRVIFCLFAEDTGIFEDQLFTRTLTEWGGRDGTSAQVLLRNLFAVMNLDTAARAGKPTYQIAFPYVNGGLFAGAIDAPRFSRAAWSHLMDAARLTWAEINPDIFGSMIQAVVDPAQRGELGMHYTSVPNILKVLDPLFLDDLRADLEAARGSRRRLQAFLARLGRTRVFDPACGSGNFLVVAYRCLRELEINALRALDDLDHSRTHLGAIASVVELRSFFGIEIADFAAETAKLALWIAEYQMNRRLGEAFGMAPPALPLRESGNIVCDNALRMDWAAVCPPATREVARTKVLDLATVVEVMGRERVPDPEAETWVVGNPPYYGRARQTDEQKADMAQAMDHRVVGWRNMDYVAAWFVKASEMLAAGTINGAAFVATNSLCQGQMVGPFWGAVLYHGIEISFAHTSFKWRNSAAHNAAIICIIVGLGKNRRQPKLIVDGEQKRTVNQISVYLTANEVLPVIPKRQAPEGLPEMTFGSMANDRGHLLLTQEERDRLVMIDPRTADFIRPFVGSQEFIRGLSRCCIWIEPNEVALALALPTIGQRVDALRQDRLASDRESTRDLAAVPWRFGEVRQRSTGYNIIVPRHSSEARRYLPVGILEPRCIIGDSALAVFDAPVWVFAVLASRMHRIWADTVCGRIKTDLRYSNTLGWHTFPVPPLSDADRAQLDATARAILLAREAHAPATIAQLYDPEAMPADLRAAHDANDRAIEALYRQKPFRTDTERLEHLFARYAEMAKGRAAEPEPASEPMDEEEDVA